MRFKGFLQGVVAVAWLGVATAAQAVGTATDDTATTTMNVAVEIDVTANDGTLGPSEGISNVSTPANGTAVVSGDKMITYTPKSGYTGTDSFTYELSGTPGATATVTVTVNPPPNISISLANATVDEGSEITLSPTVTGGAPTLSYSWQITAGAQNLEIVGATTEKTVKVKGKEVGATTTAKVRLTVTDSSPTPQTASKEVTITINNVVVSMSPEITGAGDFNEGATKTLTVNEKGGKWPYSYQWEITQGAAAVSIEGSSTGQSVSLKGKEVAADTTIEVKVTVTDSSLPKLTKSATVSMKVTNVTAALNPELTGAGDFNEGATKTLTVNEKGGKSPYTYQWEITQGAAAVSIEGSSTGKSVSLKGKEVAADTTIAVKVTVTDSSLPKLTKTATVSMKVKNVTAAFNPEITGAGDFNEGATKTLTVNEKGGKSPYTYQWEITQGAAAVSIEGSSTGKSVSLKGKEVAADTTIAVKVTVTDSSLPKLTKTATVSMKVKNVTAAFNPEITGAGDFNEGATKTLTVNEKGGKSPYTYQWEITQGAAAVSIEGSSTGKSVRLKGEEVAADTTIAVKVTVTDSSLPKLTKTATVSMKVKNVKKKPVANAGSNQTVAEGGTVTLDGSASKDPDGSIGRYVWTSVDDPEIVLAEVVKPTFTAPRVSVGGKVLRFRLRVEDNDKQMSDNVAEVAITVENSLNDAPVAKVSEPVDSVKPGAVFQLDASASTDPDGVDDIASYTWTQKESDTLRLEILQGEGKIGRFKAPAINGTVQLTIVLTVTDQGLPGKNPPEAPKSSTVEIPVVVTLDENLKRPIADAGEIVSVDVGKPVTLDGSASRDANEDGAIVSYEWKQVRGTVVALQSSDQAIATFTAPTSINPDPGKKTESLVFELKVIDNDNLFDTDRVVVNVGPNERPVVDAGEDQFDVEEGATVTLSGTASDPDGSISKVEWKQVGGSAAEQVVFSSDHKHNVSFVTPPVTGGKDALTLEFEFIARDNLGGVGRDSVTVTVKDNGITTVPDAFVPIRSQSDDEKPVGFDVSGARIVKLAPEKAPLNERNDQVGRPRKVPYGLFDFTLRVENPGDSAEVRIWVPDDLSNGYDWFKYDAGHKRWTPYANAKFDGHEIVLTLTDGGEGDDDGKADGFIHDPSGPGSEIAKERTRIEGSSGGGAWGWPIGLPILGAGVWRARRRRVAGRI